MNSPFNVEEYSYSDDQLAVMNEAGELEIATKTAGWVRIRAFMEGLVEAAQLQVATCNTMNEKVCADAVREYQAKNDFLKQIQLYVGSAIAQRDALAPRNQLEHLILKEQINGGKRSGFGEPGDA